MECWGPGFESPAVITKRRLTPSFFVFGRKPSSSGFPHVCRVRLTPEAGPMYSTLLVHRHALVWGSRNVMTDHRTTYIVFGRLPGSVSIPPVVVYTLPSSLIMGSVFYSNISDSFILSDFDTRWITREKPYSYPYAYILSLPCFYVDVFCQWNHAGLQ